MIKQRTYSTSTSTTPTTTMSRCPTGEDYGALYALVGRLCLITFTLSSVPDPDTYPHPYQNVKDPEHFFGYLCTGSTLLYVEVSFFKFQV